MIVFELACQALGHRFEGWFASSAAFAEQRAAGLVVCPDCGSPAVDKAVMAPAIARKGNQVAARGKPPRADVAGSSAEAARMMRALAAAQADALKSSRWVGDRFVEDARAMHYGERAAETIHGRATRHEAKALHEEGITIAPLICPVVPPSEAN